MSWITPGVLIYVTNLYQMTPPYLCVGNLYYILQKLYNYMIFLLFYHFLNILLMQN